MKPWLTNKLLLMSVAWQVFSIVVLELVPEKKDTPPDEELIGFEVAVIVILLFQGLHLLFVVVVSIKLVKQILHKTVSPWFLAQSYLSTILLYAGIYTMIYKIAVIKELSPFSFAVDPAASAGRFKWVLTWVSFLYFSTATMTTVGYGDISASVWYTRLIAASEMLFSILYSAVILSIGLQHFTTKNNLVPIDEASSVSKQNIFFNKPLVELGKMLQDTDDTPTIIFPV
uniref:Potassium channel domain-containing protein n=1 Tax=Arcella intermedia TaxID=1963864 RepID=A0A6B2LG96_9EUKA